MRTTITIVLAIAAVGWAVATAMDASANDRESDIVRQWVVCQYVNSGHDPYSLAKDILVAKYGVGNPRRVAIYAIPKAVPDHRQADVLPELGTPEATYPPPAVGLLAPTVGLLADPLTVLWFWFAVNVAVLGWVVHRLTRLWPVPPGGGTVLDNHRFVFAALLLFPPTYSTLVAGQFSLLVLGLLLVASDPSGAWLPRGLALGVALLKPSVALPFFFLPVVRREWRVVLVAVAVQAVAGGYVAVRTGSTIDSFRDWLTVAGYFLHGMYTVHEWLSLFSTKAPWVISVVPLGLLALCGVTLAVGRHLPHSRLFALAAVTSVFWTYHGSYDFVFLLPVVLPLVGWSDGRPGKQWSATGLVLFAVLAVALIPAVLSTEGDPVTRAIRWGARFVVIGLFAREYVRIYWGVLRTGNGHPST
jgi:Glycosyltransferase family 87